MKEKWGFVEEHIHAFVVGIILVALDCLHLFGIGDGDVYFVPQKVKHRNQILTGRFHADITTGIVQQPFLNSRMELLKVEKRFF